ncbi:LPXTG cell wall anchor domain-containing protein [Streptomyces spongiae]|uniref:LPXTG cell wall anchor domain-containing protein n=1 Tax=Streptomyces spongiae TaxID=565072 RepID=A0A5N8XR68_9ACTN|nr:LPXTG cell wall anchor domain-containing protein [Streptomyces spongiae]MPY61911.1 LPXTG cell wall anchor domain-containing protein [Streptomyces spongiae]
MKLRRALATAAAAAVLAPPALLSAPAAFADEPSTPNGTPSTSTPGAAPESTPGATPETTPPTTTSEPEATPSTSAPVDQKPAANTAGARTPTSTPSQSSAADPLDPDIPFCEELDEDFDDVKVSAEVKGLPGKIVAGSGRHAFQLVVTNDSDVDVSRVAFYAEVENDEADEDKFLSPHADLEFKNPEDGKWTRIGDDDWAGDYFSYVDELKAKASEKFDLRVSIDAKAPVGDAWSFGSGAYLDKVDDQDCVAEGWAEADFEVLKAGTSNPDPGEAEPGDKDEKDEKDSVKKPQGDVSELPTGSLAHTGSSSALPVIGLVGGIAVVAGAGAVFLVRRRKGEDTTA